MRTAVRTGALGIGVLFAAAMATAQSADAAKIARGKYLMTIGACNDCHSPKIDPQQHPDPKRPFSGRPQTTQAPSPTSTEIHASLDLTAWAGPWGVSYGANLSPDSETGDRQQATGNRQYRSRTAPPASVIARFLLPVAGSLFPVLRSDPDRPGAMPERRSSLITRARGGRRRGGRSDLPRARAPDRRWARASPRSGCADSR